MRLAHNLIVPAALRGGQENIDHILDRPHGPCEQEGRGCGTLFDGSLSLPTASIPDAEPSRFSLLVGDKPEQKLRRILVASIPQFGRNAPMDLQRARKQFPGDGPQVGNGPHRGRDVVLAIAPVMTLGIERLAPLSAQQRT